MKECWINVYEIKLASGNNIWYGTPRPNLWECEIVANRFVIYRIHVRIK